MTAAMNAETATAPADEARTGTLYYWWECCCGADGFTRHLGIHHDRQGRHLRAVLRRGEDVMAHDFSTGTWISE